MVGQCHLLAIHNLRINFQNRNCPQEHYMFYVVNWKISNNSVLILFLLNAESHIVVYTISFITIL